MKLDIICVGKLKEKYLAEGVEEYLKRLSKYCKIQIIEIADEKTKDGASTNEEDIIKQKEGKKILKAIKENSYVVTLDLRGEMLTSEQFATFIHKRGLNRESYITFIIGGSLGISNEVLSKAHYSLCFSKMTFPHQLFRMMLIEQIYRAYRINFGEPYHK
ncbi:23S rRNA (pseudouridine(1915)-N(3))-methyltransferase RlmH [Candidatus Epulonipiscium fishelsonii]|uniref:23S rRNA (Pseudouridine(1915)-N(3))-methyltransferase RlmH n=1 Tax=Candidatus Epulonipiscium fishelsonii TaxID=77094 RepID=A0ACC8XGQ3_9FIRM|nr:23S rRNA (pseudouridine(1915)-N(3))-methyltransferase RlmH [Epulopiscium sp. SCG-B05WGA-EpuloA1]ONI42705.1 23S rRNA (pseudouridine(1915)-N(3))-methyltransferase RlmH [Epulopiscium sp. SCG-B11WGA-EpuloA1]ONI47028.1 23S rRNA (pseudouridine(1915)-N(3))-methyltransferase RlmH [Epulopiscium sp. SCG-C06WGA-EpuloA1]